MLLNTGQNAPSFAQSLSQPHIMSILYKKFHILTFVTFIQTGKGGELSGKNAFNLGTSTDDPRINFEIEISQQVHLQSAPNFADIYYVLYNGLSNFEVSHFWFAYKK